MRTTNRGIGGNGKYFKQGATSWTIDQTKLNPELTQWLATRQSALKIAKTTTTPSGHTLDWIPIESQDPTGKIASPPAVTSLPVRLEDKEKPALPVTLELDDPKVERGPAGTVPLLRPNLSVLTRTIALEGLPGQARRLDGQ